MHLEKRLVDTLIKHWRRRKGKQEMLVYEQFVPDALGDRIWQHCCTFALLKSNQRWILTNEFMGDYVESALGRDISGQVIMTSKHRTQHTRLLEKTEEVLGQGEPLIDQGHFVNELSQIIKFRSCLLPFGRGGNYTHIVLGLSWRSF